MNLENRTAETPADPVLYALGLLAEEAGEIVQLVGKALRFGLDTPGIKEPNGTISPDTPRSRLPAEIGDLFAAAVFACAHGLLDGAAIDQAKESKLSRLLDPAARDNLGRQLAPQPACGPELRAILARGREGDRRLADALRALDRISDLVDDVGGVDPGPIREIAQDALAETRQLGGVEAFVRSLPSFDRRPAPPAITHPYARQVHELASQIVRAVRP